MCFPRASSGSWRCRAGCPPSAGPGASGPRGSCRSPRPNLRGSSPRASGSRTRKGTRATRRRARVRRDASSARFVRMPPNRRGGGSTRSRGGGTAQAPRRARRRRRETSSPSARPRSVTIARRGCVCRRVESDDACVAYLRLRYRYVRKREDCHVPRADVVAFGGTTFVACFLGTGTNQRGGSLDPWRSGAGQSDARRHG